MPLATRWGPLAHHLLLLEGIYGDAFINLIKLTEKETSGGEEEEEERKRGEEEEGERQHGERGETSNSSSEKKRQK